MVQRIAKLMRDVRGGSAAEYALIVAVLGGFIVLGSSVFGTALNTAMDNNGKALSKASEGTF